MSSVILESRDVRTLLSTEKCLSSEAENRAIFLICVKQTFVKPRRQDA